MTVCTAAGNVTSYSSTNPVVETDTLFIDRGAGSHWTLEPIPGPTLPRASIEDVACPTATTCYAIGDEGSSTDYRNLFEQRT